MWSDEDEAYIATIPEFPGLSAFGDTPDEAVKEVQVVCESFIEVYKKDRIELPNPIKITD